MSGTANISVVCCGLIGTLISAFTLIMGWLYNRRPPEPDDKPKPAPPEEPLDPSSKAD